MKNVYYAVGCRLRSTKCRLWTQSKDNV